MEETKERKYSHSIMTKNVTEFRHLIKNPHATENDITWAINLRAYSKSPNKMSKDGMAPEVYHKKTKLGQIRKQQFLNSKSKGILPFKCSQYHHMIPKHNEKTLKHSSSAITFFSSLRKNEQFQGKQNNNKFSCIPYKDKHEPPKILKKGYMKKTQSINKQDLDSAQDGNHKFPNYTQNILKTKNYAVLKNFTEVRGRGKVALPGLAWQVGLRGY